MSLLSMPWAYTPDPTRSRSLFNAKIYIGLPDLNPRDYPKEVHIVQEDGNLIVAEQPIRTNSGGVPTYNDSPVSIDIDGDYSIAIDDRYDSQIYNLAIVSNNEELQSIARSLNALDSQVIYSTDTTTVLDDVLYIYDAGAQVTWGKPSSVGAGEFIVSVVGDTITTNTNAYTLHDVSAGRVAMTGLETDAITPALGDLIMNTTRKTLVLGDGVTQGGIPVGEELSAPTVESFGAIGDGITDDTTAIQSAIDNGTCQLTEGKEYLHSGLTLTSLMKGNGAQLTYAGTGDGITLGYKGYLHDAVVRPQLTGTSKQIVTNAPSDMQLIGCDIRQGTTNIHIDLVTFGLTITRNIIGDASGDNIFGNQVKRCIISDNYIIAAVGWGIDIDAASALDPDQEHGVVMIGNHIFGNESGGIRHTGQSAVDKAQHCVIVGNHIDHNYKDADVTKASYGIYVQNTERPLINGNLIRSQSVMGVYLEDCSVPVVTGNQFWKSTANPALTDIAIQAVNSERGQFVGNGRDSSDIILGLDDWALVDRFEMEHDAFRARGNIYNLTHRQQAGTGANEGNLFVNHNFDGVNRRCEWNNLARTDFTFKVVGTVEATVGFTPFTGKHIFWSQAPIKEGFAVDLVGIFANAEQGAPQGEVSLTKNERSKVCAGIVEHCQPMSDIDYIDQDEGYFVMVAAVGDNNTDRLNGFRVNISNGEIEAGDILVTSSVRGELMRADEKTPDSVVRFKCMSKPVNGRCYGYFK